MNDIISIILLVLRLGLALSLYAFLGLALFTIWQSVQSQAKQIEQETIPKITLIPTGTTHNINSELSFTFPHIFIGRDPECEVLISNPTISSRHARLYYEQAQWWIEDLDSKNGTQLNGSMIEFPIAITGQDQLQFGEVIFVIRIGN